MTAAEMHSMIDSAVAAKIKAEQKERNAILEGIKSGMRDVAERLPALREIAPVAYRLKSMGLGNYGYGFQNKFCTDGIGHQFGFARLNGIPFVYFGAEAGGACGPHDLFVNINTGKWTCKAQIISCENRIGPEMSSDEFAQFAVAPYVSCGRIIDERKYFICRNLVKMASGIDDYIASVEEAVKALAG